MQKINKIILLSSVVLIVVLLVYAGFRDESGNFQADKLLAQVAALVVVLGFIFLVVFLIKRFNPEQQEQKTDQNPMQAQTEEVHRDFVLTPTQSNVTFKDVAGINEVKEELVEIVDFLKNPGKYRRFDIKLPKGVLLVGPPGVGKTLIAKAVAGEAGVPFFYQSGATFVQMYVGIGAQRVKKLFSVAKAMAPSIIFIDEIDALGKSRGMTRNDEREATLNQLLTEMDGFENSEGVIIIAATNKVEMLDDALLRSGRFDRRVHVELPGLSEREAILTVHLKNRPFQGDVLNIAKMTVGFSGAALASLVNEASIHALKKDKMAILEEDFVAVKDKVLMGKKKILSYNNSEKNILSFYQAAKAVTAYWLDIDFEKITLVKDDFKEIDKELISKSELLGKIKVYLSGIVCVEDIFKEKFSHAQKDIHKAKEIAQKMITEYGMGDYIIANEMEISTIINEEFNHTKVLYISQKEIIEKAQLILLEKEVIHKEELKEIFNEIL